MNVTGTEKLDLKFCTNQKEKVDKLLK
jgi:hypothetical protein